jgi:hypothetical protein
MEYTKPPRTALSGFICSLSGFNIQFVDAGVNRISYQR